MIELESIDPREQEEAAELARLLAGYEGGGTPQDVVEVAALLRSAHAIEHAEPSIEQRLPAIADRLFGASRSKRRFRRLSAAAATIAVAASVFVFVDGTNRVAHEPYEFEASAPSEQATQRSGAPSAASEYQPGLGDSMSSASGNPAQVRDPLAAEQEHLLEDADRSLELLASLERWERTSRLRSAPGGDDRSSRAEADILAAYREAERQGPDDAIDTLRAAERIASDSFIDRGYARSVERDVALACALIAFESDDMRRAVAFARAGLAIDESANPQVTSLAIVLERAYAALGARSEAEAAHRRARGSLDATTRAVGASWSERRRE